MSMATLHESTDRVFDLPVEQVWSDDDFNCRGPIPKSDILDLAASIDKDGLQNPIIVRELEHSTLSGQLYSIIAGHCRYAAHLHLGKKVIQARIRRGISDADAIMMNLTENLMRRDLNLMQEARAISRLHDRMSMTDSDLATRLRKSRKWVQARLYALDMEPEIQKEIERGMLKQNAIFQLHKIKDRKGRLEAAKTLKERQQRVETAPVQIRKSDRVKKLHATRVRERAELFEMQDHIYDQFGFKFDQLPVELQIGVRMLGWAAGEATDFEVYESLRQIAEHHGKRYEMPEGVIEEAMA